jgi:phosphoesterase RecJ-like protein
VDVAAIAAHFGGGGHRCASGCSLPGPVSVAAERTLAQLRICRRSGTPAPSARPCG